MKTRYSLSLMATAAFFGTASLARAADPDTAGSLTTSADAASIPAVPTAIPTVAAVRPAMAEVFRPAPVPGDELRAPTHQVADAGPNLHPDVLSVHENTDGALSDTDLAYNRNERVKPAGGMSLNIPMQ